MTLQRYIRAVCDLLISQPATRQVQKNSLAYLANSKSRATLAKSPFTWSNLTSKNLPDFTSFNFTTRHHKNPNRVQYSIFSQQRKSERNVYSSSVDKLEKSSSFKFSIRKRRNSCIKLINRRTSPKAERGKIFVENPRRPNPSHGRKLSYQGNNSNAFNTPKLKKLNSELTRPERVLRYRLQRIE